MGRNIKFYSGSYIAQTSNKWDATSTGYTVPSGKVARIGFDLAARGGSNDSTYRACAGFFAGSNGVGSTTTGNSTNRFLMVYTPGAVSTSRPIGVYLNLNYNPTSGHKWLARDYEEADPKLYLGDSQHEKYISRDQAFYYFNNFRSASADISSGWGTLGFSEEASTIINAQRHLFAPIYRREFNADLTSANLYNGPVHAFAGETIYLWDWADLSSSSWNYRAFGKAQWSMFIVEEDA